MKKILLIIIAIITLTITATFAQDKSFYIKVYGGYTLFTPGSDIQPAFYGANDENNVSSADGGTYTGSRLGAGAGINYGAGIGMQLNKLWLVGIDVNNLPGQTLNFKQDGTTDNDIITESAKHSVLSIIPNITYKVINMPNYFVYSRLGIMVAVNTKSNFTYSDVGNTDFGTSTETDKFTYSTSLGLQGAVGIQYKLTGRLSVFGEFTGNFLSVKPKTQVTKSTNVGGGLTQNFNYNITYLNSNSGTATRTIATTTSGNVTTTTFNQQEPPILEHINSVVFNVGLVFGFH